MSRKQHAFLAGLSVLAGLTGRFVVKHNKQPLTTQNLTLYYIGTWTFRDPIKKIQHQLEISPELDFKLDGLTLEGSVIEINEQTLTFLDHYGYHLILTAAHHTPISLYDEADDLTYHFD